MRQSKITRTTRETDISLAINLDGSGKHDISSGVGFFDHMLTLFAVHSGFDLDLTCNGDTFVDAHHSVEDIGITLGQSIAKALGDKVGIARYASFTLPMDETLVTVSLDLSGRAFLVYNAESLSMGKTGDFDCQLVEEFMRAVAFNAGITLHINLQYGSNYHHMAEAIFKAFARALSIATTIINDRIPSSKGIL